MRSMLAILAILIVAAALVFVLRFGLSGDEDTWLCRDGAWVKHGNPASTAPAEGCGPSPTMGTGAAPDYRNGTYVIDGALVSLSDGISMVSGGHGASDVTTTRVSGDAATGDLDGDGKDDVAFILLQETGGTGTFFNLAVALASEGSVHRVVPVLIGDRIAPQSTEIKTGTIIVKYADRGPDDSFADPPSVNITAYLQVQAGKLVKVSIPDGGQKACTMEAKQCPDGSYVGRSGPRCEFAPCP